MDFEFTDDQLALRENARSVLAGACPLTVARGVHEGTGDPAALWTTLVSLGWPGLGIPEANGGLGLGALEVGIVVEELGRAVAPTPFLATMTQLVPMIREAGSDRLLGAVATGDCTGTLALAEAGSWRAETVRASARHVDGRWVLDGVKDHVLDAASADWLAVVTRGDAGVGVFLVPREAVTTTPVVAMDPTTPMGTVELRAVEVAAADVLIEPGDPSAAAAVDRALHEAVTAMALSTTATCRRLFEVTLQYTKDRQQFGRPIGSFQAIKHRLADLYLAVERAAALAHFAALTIAEDDPRRAVAASMAKAAAGECQRVVVRDALQLHGGVGFTWEHDLHLLLKRAKTGDLLLGTAATHRAQLAELLGLAS